MASLTITIANADVPDVLAAVEQVWAGVAINQSFGGNAALYEAATLTARGQALLRAYLSTTTANYRLSVAQTAVAPPPAPVVT